MSRFEKKFGKYAIRNLSLILIVCYAFGYLMEYVNADFLGALTLNPYAILHGQIWRVITWILVPPDSSNLFFVAISLFFYYSIGTSLERTWGTYRYNVYLFSGILFTVAASFLLMAYCYVFDAALIATVGAPTYFAYYAMLFSTYYVNMSIFLAFAATFPDSAVLLFFILPVKVKYLGILYAVLLGISFVSSSVPLRFVMLGSLLNFFIFWLRAMKAKKNLFRRAAGRFKKGAAGRGTSAGSVQTAVQSIRRKPGAVHRCAVCGRTEEDDPNLEFRYCSKCDGDYEYCQDHIFTHVHVHGKGNKG